MDLFNNLSIGFTAAFTLQNLLYCLFWAACWAR
jgi:TctA family transporter